MSLSAKEKKITTSILKSRQEALIMLLVVMFVLLWVSPFLGRTRSVYEDRLIVQFGYWGTLLKMLPFGFIPPILYYFLMISPLKQDITNETVFRKLAKIKKIHKNGDDQYIVIDDMRLKGKKLKLQKEQNFPPVKEGNEYNITYLSRSRLVIEIIETKSPL